MQDKVVAGDPEYLTKELRAYGFKLVDWTFDNEAMATAVNYVLTGKTDGETAKGYPAIMNYIAVEHGDRTRGVPMNPGNAYKQRPEVWSEFLHDGKFAYTYSERFAPQLERIITELAARPETRQAIINIHSNICPVPDYMVGESVTRNTGRVWGSADLQNTGGGGRIPCSMYYQMMIREGKLDLIYTMRSCDFLTHFPVDFALATMMQNYVARRLGLGIGTFTYFAGSFHAYQRDLKVRGIF